MISESVGMEMELEVPENPFPGLRPFEFRESLLYFGRDGQSEGMLAKLAKHRFVAVVGTSGSGKSSLVRAGLLPALFGGFMTSAGSDWRVAIMRPGNDPLGNLARALNDPSVFGSDIEENAALQAAITEATLRRGSLGLVETVRQTRMPANESLLIIADQFEELFRFAHTSQSEQYQNEAAAFVKLLLEAINQRDIPIYVVLTLRSDYLGDCSLFWGLPEAINESQYLIPRLTREQRKEAITGPVAVCGGDITPRLVNLLLNDMGDNPDQLPILQHALMRTWNRWKEIGPPDEPLDIRHYHDIGTMSTALSLHAEEAFKELPGARSHEIAEKLFKGLTEKGADNREIRRPIILRELCELIDASEAEVVAVVDVFRQAGRSFLVPPAGVPLRPDSLVDISHESLIRNWQRLKKWVEEEARSARIYQRLAETAALHDKGEAGFWGDPDLQLALNWREQNKPNHVWAARYHPNFDGAMTFLDASRAKRDWEIAEREAARRAELRRTRFFAAVLLVAFLFSLGTTVFAFVQMSRADTEAHNALKQKGEAERQAQIAHASEVKAKESGAVAIEQAQIAEREKEKAKESQAIAVTEAQRAHENEVEAKESKAVAVKEAQRAHENELKALSANRIAEEQKQRALEQTRKAQVAKQEAIDQGIKSRNLLYDANLNLAQQASKDNNSDRAKELLDTAGIVQYYATENGDRKALDWRGFEWYYLWRLYHKDRATLKDHTKPVVSVAFSPDSTMLATASYDNTVKIWNAAKREVVAKLKGHTNSVLAIAFSPDGKMLASGGDDNMVRVWDTSAPVEPATPPKELTPLKGHTGSVTAVAFSRDGVIATGSNDNTVKLWVKNGAGGYTTYTLKGHTAALRSVAFSPDGKLLASAGLDNTVRLWDTSAPKEPATLRKELATLKGHTGWVSTVAFSPDGKMLASGGDDNMARVWDTSAPKDPATLQKELMKLEGHTKTVTSVNFSTDGRTLATASSDKSVKLWDIATQKELARLEGHSEPVTSVVFSGDGKTIATGSFDRTAKLWDTTSLHGLTTLTGHTDAVLSVAFSPDGQTVATASNDNTVKLWDALTRRELAATLRGHTKAVTSVAFSPDGTTIATGSYDHTIKLWDATRLSDAAKSRELDTLTGHTDKVLSVAFSRDGVIASGGNDNTVRLWVKNGAGGYTTYKLEGHTESVTAVAFSPNGKILATGSYDKTVKLWDVATRKLLPASQSLECEGPTEAVTSIAFSPDGRMIASGSNDKNVTLWVFNDVGGNSIYTLKGHTDAVLSIAFSLDGKTLASGGGDNVVKLWSVGSHQELATLKDFESPVSSVAFSPDSKILATASFASVVKLWYAATEADVGTEGK